MIFFYVWKNVFLDTYCSVIWINWYVIFMQLEEITWFHSFRNFKLICNFYRRLFELSESLTGKTLSDINFHLNICMNIQFHRYIHLKYQFVCKLMKKSLWKIWTDLDLKVGCIKKDRRLFELSESLNTLSDINFHLKDCKNNQFYWYYHLKYQFVYKSYIKKHDRISC